MTGYTGGWKVSVDRDWGWDAWRVWIYRVNLDGSRDVLNFAAPTEMHIEALALSEGCQPLILQVGIAERLVAEFAQNGVRGDQEARNEGELQATKRHLEDLQRIVFNVDKAAKP